MISKKYIIASVVTILLSSTMVVFAEDSNKQLIKPVHVEEMKATQMVVQIGPEGRTLLRGTIETIGSGSLTVKSWGGNWIVNISSSTKLMPTTDMSKFKTGDFVGVQGMATTSGTWVIDASLIRDWTAEKVMAEAKRQEQEAKKQAQLNEKKVKELMKSVQPRNWEGVASSVNVDAKTLSLTVEGVVYTINLATNAKIVNERFVAINFSAIKDGDKVRVYGPSSNNVITAVVVRDVSVK